MFRLTVLTVAATFASVAAFAATEVMMAPEADVIRIEVSQDELAGCQEDLRALESRDPVADDGTPLFFGGADDMPGTVCVLRDA
ncbi:hypothetical protein GCM10011415_33050 [Salipiger pallidus]|uniref:Uncharacterized protein n=1 Tax=Salipiger pallidus TaxID=1775170 RepID=A0A8J2ZMH6_9RHOB|nr:hypothetical protein [Salipiger pallidus]GGG80967.1 hypothetical protein GCM10011415_33050 [Salipiger pallidus]